MSERVHPQLEKRQCSRESGVALLEFAIIGPMMFFLFFVTVDFTMYVQSYFRATHILREALRIASVTPELTVGVSVNNNLADAGYQSIHHKIAMLLEAEDFNTSTRSSNPLRGLRLKTDAGTYSENLSVSGELLAADDTVEIRLSGDYDSLLAGLLGSFPLSYSVVGRTPYLYQSSP